MTPPNAAPPLDHRPQELEIRIPKLLRAGLTLAALILAIGLTLFAANPPAGGARFSLFDIGPLLGSGDPRGVIGLGILILLLTPLGRVVASLAHFAKERDRLYVVITAVVLANLLLAVALNAL